MNEVGRPAAWQMRDEGLLLPRQISGHAAVELCNSLAGWGEGRSAQTEYLLDHAHLVALTKASGVVTGDRAARIQAVARRRPVDADAVVHDARRLRADLYALLTGKASAAASRRVRDQVREARARQSLVPGEHAWARWEFSGRPTVREPLDGLLVAIGELLTTPTRVGRCPGLRCGWLFVDPSGRRRWCLMAACGNRAKQAAHTARRRTGKKSASAKRTSGS